MFDRLGYSLRRTEARFGIWNQGLRKRLNGLSQWYRLEKLGQHPAGRKLLGLINHPSKTPTTLFIFFLIALKSNLYCNLIADYLTPSDSDLVIIGGESGTLLH